MAYLLLPSLLPFSTGSHPMNVSLADEKVPAAFGRQRPTSSLTPSAISPAPSDGIASAKNTRQPRPSSAAAVRMMIVTVPPQPNTSDSRTTRANSPRRPCALTYCAIGKSIASAAQARNAHTMAAINNRRLLSDESIRLTAASLAQPAIIFGAIASITGIVPVRSHFTKPNHLASNNRICYTSPPNIGPQPIDANLCANLDSRILSSLRLGASAPLR